MRAKDELLAAIDREQALIGRLEREREEAQARVRSLQAQLSTPAEDVDGSVSPPPPSTAGQKVALFRGLFRGRDDVFAKLWVNPRTDRKGYAPACANEWVRGVCEKPRVKCSECPNQAFISVSDQVVLDHLQGRHVIGVYPLLEDDTCWFLAADFDEESWADDVAAFVETSRILGLSAAVERSRSGNGAHVWFFFAAPVPAATARRMSCYLITETMSRRHQLAMASYDRLFPNQDMLPRGGFGNLIALPLQHEARERGNTVFVDDRLVPHADQWAYLASLSRIAPTTVDAIAREAVARGQVIGLRIASTGEDEDETPWEAPPSRRPRPARIEEPLPSEVRAVLAQRIFVEKARLPSAFLNQIKRVAAFQNPEFYKRQKMRLSTALTPRVVACAEEHSRHVALPRGCVGDLRDLLADHGVGLRLDDQRVLGESLKARFHGHLTEAQEQAAKSLLAHDLGVFVAPPGVGKTVVGIYLAAARGRSTLVLVHRKPLLDQWVAQLSLFLGLPPKGIGQIGGGKRTPTGRLDVAMLQSLVRDGTIDDVVAAYGHVIVDECHHVPAASFERVMGEVKARYVTGLTATPYRRDGHQPIIHMQCGPVRFAIDPKSEKAQRPFEHRLICRETAFRAASLGPGAGIQELYAAIAADGRRNELILNDVIGALEQGRSPILLTERRDHLEYFAARLRGFTRHLVVLQGGVTAKARREAKAQLAAIPSDEERLILATGRYIGEGFDDARLDTLFLAMPVSWKGTLVQYTGRLHRLSPGKIEVRIYDYVDPAVPLLARMFEKRLRGYRTIGYAREETPPTPTQLGAEPTVELDEGVFPTFDGAP
ncbi:MAG: restriction endonuclease subunit R [Deltaproteobacteria bacterium]|nr:MAG: restriction endonuclease subunit R [Deltaproteobacteria bacterium]